METKQQQQEQEEEDGDEEAYAYLHPQPKAFTFQPMTPEKGSPLLSPFSVRISNYSSEEENECSSESGQVDNQAEDFITRFYEQLKMQRRLQLLQYT